MQFIVNDAMAAPTAPADNTVSTEATPDQPYELSSEKMMQDNMLILGLLFFIFYFILIRPQQRRIKHHREMMKGLQKGSKVITGGGILGTVIKLEDNDIALVEIAPNVRVRVPRHTISEVLDDKAVAGASANDN